MRRNQKGAQEPRKHTLANSRAFLTVRASEKSSERGGGRRPPSASERPESTVRERGWMEGVSWHLQYSTCSNVRNYFGGEGPLFLNSEW